MASQRPSTGKTRPPTKESTQIRDVGPETEWHTRGLQGGTRSRQPMTAAQRTPRRQLPPSRVPRLLAWGLVLAVMAIVANALLRMTG